ncbi:MAG: hypothetical protein ACYTJ0_18530, partial [Planctomycetota bacterium]
DRYLQAAWELRRLGARDEQLRALEAGIERHPDDPQLAMGLCTELVLHPDPDRRDAARARAIAARIASDRGRDQPELLGLLAWLCARDGDLAQAVAAAEASVRAARERGEEALARDMEAMVRQYRAEAEVGQPR